MGLLEKGNINLRKRPIVRNKDGSISTVRSMSIGTDEGEVLIPTVSPDGRILDEQAAINLYRKQGQHLGIFGRPDEATAYAKALHEQQAQEYKRPQVVRNTMGLLDFNRPGGLFDPIAQGFGGVAPDMTKMLADVGPTNLPTFPEPGRQSRGGVFGSGHSGEDVMSMLIRAAALAQGDYGGAAQIGQNIGARARAEAEAAQERQAALQDYESKRQIDQRYEGPPDPPAIVRNLEAFQNFTPEQRRAFEEYQALVNPRYMTGADKLPYQTNAAPFDLNEWEPVEPQGGGVSNGTGGF